MARALEIVTAKVRSYQYDIGTIKHDRGGEHVDVTITVEVDARQVEHAVHAPLDGLAHQTLQVVFDVHDLRQVECAVPRDDLSYGPVARLATVVTGIDAEALSAGAARARRADP